VSPQLYLSADVVRTSHLSYTTNLQVAPEDFEMMMKKREQNHHLPNRTPSYPANRLSQGTYHIVQVRSVC
jgi:hypothetical protein